MRAGDVLGGRYRLDERIAAGGMGTVWRGHDDRLHRDVAVKVLHPNLSGDETFRRRFHIEARAIAALDAPGIVNVYDFGEETADDGEVVYLVMQLVEGEPLSAVLRRGRLSPETTMRLLADCADALSVAHNGGIIHRDIKPANILLDSREKVKIVDFGIARSLGQDGVTTTGMVMGTMSYVAPEQLKGADPNPSGDIYSLGVVGYQCLAGRTPFEYDVLAAIIAATLDEQPPPLPGTVPEPVAAVIMRALAKDPKQRWDDAAAFARACRYPQAAPGPVAVPAPAPTGTGPASRHRLLWALVAILAVVLLGVGAAIIRPWSNGDTADGARDPGSASPSQKSASASVSDTDESTTESEATGADDPTEKSEPEDEPSSSGVEKITIPDVSGMHMDPARRKLEGKGFTNIAVNSPDGCWAESQYPNPGTKAKPNVYIELGIQPASEGEQCPIS